MSTPEVQTVVRSYHSLFCEKTPGLRRETEGGQMSLGRPLTQEGKETTTMELVSKASAPTQDAKEETGRT